MAAIAAVATERGIAIAVPASTAAGSVSDNVTFDIATADSIAMLAPSAGLTMLCVCSIAR
jgi:hypothetical protein